MFGKLLGKESQAPGAGEAEAAAARSPSPSLDGADDGGSPVDARQSAGSSRSRSMFGALLGKQTQGSGDAEASSRSRTPSPSADGADDGGAALAKQDSTTRSKSMFGKLLGKEGQAEADVAADEGPPVDARASKSMFSKLLGQAKDTFFVDPAERGAGAVDKEDSLRPQDSEALGGGGAAAVVAPEDEVVPPRSEEPVKSGAPRGKAEAKKKERSPSGSREATQEGSTPSRRSSTGSQQRSAELEEAPAGPPATVLAVTVTMVGEGSPGGGDDDAQRDEGDEEGEVDTERFEELRLAPEVVMETQALWAAFLEGSSNMEAAGELIYSALFEGAPSLQPLFTTPRAVQGIRFMEGLSALMRNIHNPPALKVKVEELGFGHLNLEVTVPRIVLFRDALLDMFESELGDQLTEGGLEGMTALLNHVGGALVYIRNNYGGRLSMIVSSWAAATHKAKDEQILPESHFDEGGNPLASQEDPGSPGRQKQKAESKAKQFKTSFEDMFYFNSSVMGYGSRKWFDQVLKCFPNIVASASNPARLQMECDFLVLKIANCGEKGPVNLPEFKSCMLACLRSLLPKQWDPTHEVAWGWLWDNVERLLSNRRTPEWHAALRDLMASLDADTLFEMRTSTYDGFFTAAPVGQEFFKQSSTRLHFIAQRILDMTVQVFVDPWGMIEEISEQGLRHVGYGIPPELFGPYVTSAIRAVEKTAGDKPVALEAFRWSLGLISKAIVQTIHEGSTIVMKAINANSVRQLRKAMGCAPRGERAEWLLKVQVGSQSISPLMWALNSGRLETASAVIEDLLTIRADREMYYYGVDHLFKNHPDIVHTLAAEAPSLLQVFLDGLIWRSATRQPDGLRRVNYYVKYLIVSDEGGFSPALRELVNAKDPEIMSHVCIIFVSDTLWSGIVSKRFVGSKIWFLLSLLVFMLSQAILPKWSNAKDPVIAWPIFVFRCLMYLGTMSRLLFVNARDSIDACRTGDVIRIFGCIKLPGVYRDGYKLFNFVLALLLLGMLTLEPFLYCLTSSSRGSSWPTEDCPEARKVEMNYSVLCLLAMLTHWFLLTDLSVFNTGMSAFVLVVTQLMTEIGRFLIAFTFLLVTFASAICVLEHSYTGMHDLWLTMLALFAITIKLYEDDYRDLMEDPVLLAILFTFLTFSSILLLNLLIAQLNVSYVRIYSNMVGYARLKRAEVICDILEHCPAQTWQSFVATLSLDTPLEFNEGDVGMGGGMQIWEPASEHLVSRDSIQRYGGAASPAEPWPESRAAIQDDDDKFNHMRRVVQGSLKRLMAGLGHTGAKRTHHRKGGDHGSRDERSRSGLQSGDEQGSSDDEGSELAK